LLEQNPILLSQALDHLLLALVDPVRNGDQHELEGIEVLGMFFRFSQPDIPITQSRNQV
jgi:hypothetical protein